MSIKISNYNFEGPYPSTADLQDKSGVYIIMSQPNFGYTPLDCGESDTVKSSLDNHGRKPCWDQHSKGGGVMYLIHYTPGLKSADRAAIEKVVRARFKFPCGP